MDIPATGASQSLSYARIGGAGLSLGIVGIAAAVAALAIVSLIPAVSATAGVALFPYAVVVLPVALGVMAVAGAVALALLFARTKQAAPAALVPPAPTPPPSPRSASPEPSPMPSPRAPSPVALAPPASHIADHSNVLSKQGECASLDPISPPTPPLSTSPLPVDSRPASPSEEELEEKATTIVSNITEEVERFRLALQISPTASPSVDFQQSMAVAPKADELMDEFVVVDPEEREVFPEAITKTWKDDVVAAGKGILGWFHQFDLTGQDAQVIRVKAAKYEALIETVNASLRSQGLAEIATPNPQDTLQYLTEVRDLFEVTVLNALRAGVERGDPAYNAVCHALYTANNMDQANSGLLDLYGVETPKGGPGLLERLEAVNETVENLDSGKSTNILNRWARSLKDKLGIRFSPIGAGNPPQKMFKLVLSDREVNILGFGSPTIQESNVSEVVIDPLFLGYLRHLKAQGKRHLYVSNQNALNEENARNSVIMALAESEEFEGTFIAITQSKNTIPS